MRKLIRVGPAFATVVVLVAIASSVQAQTPFKVGVFDAQQVSIETIDGQRAQAELRALQDKKQKEISDREVEINNLQQQLSSQALSLSIDRRTTLELDIQRRLLELNTAKELASRELQLEVAAAEARFNEKLRAAIEEFARNEGFALILDAAAVAWASAAIDITAPIVEQFNQMFPGSPAGGSDSGEGD
jgi:outer membrane protein